MNDPVTSLSFRQILSLHCIRHQERTPERTLNEVKDFLRRAAGLLPDARTIENGGLDGVTARHIRDAAMLVTRSQEDITTMFRERASA